MPSIKLKEAYASVLDIMRGVPNGTHAAWSCEHDELLLISKLHYLPNAEAVKNEFSRYRSRISGLIDPDYLASRWAGFYSSQNAKGSVAEIETHIINRDKNTCQYCGSVKKIHLHHVIPVKRMGPNSTTNIVCACESCNLAISTHIVLPVNWWDIHPESRNNPGVDSKFKSPN